LGSQEGNFGSLTAKRSHYANTLLVPLAATNPVQTTPVCWVRVQRFKDVFDGPIDRVQAVVRRPDDPNFEREIHYVKANSTVLL
jgi:hypothetical protein